MIDCVASPQSLSVSWACPTNIAEFSNAESNSTTLKIFDVAGPLSVTAIIGGTPISTNFVVHEPEIFYSIPIKANTQLYRGSAGVGCLLNIYLAPTNVSFENVWWQEGVCHATNETGWFAEFESRHPDHDEARGALRKIKSDYGEFGWCFSDDVFTGMLRKPWHYGSVEWDIPTSWWTPCHEGATNFHRFSLLSPMKFTIDANGEAAFYKFGSRGVRQTNGWDYYYDGKGERVLQ